MRAVELVLKPVPFVEAKATATVALACEQVQVAIAVPVHDIRAGNHLRGFALEDDRSFRIGKLRFFTWRARADVAIEADGILEMTADEVALAIVVPVHERTEVRPDIGDFLVAEENRLGRRQDRGIVGARVSTEVIAFVIREHEVFAAVIVPIAHEEACSAAELKRRAAGAQSLACGQGWP